MNILFSPALLVTPQYLGHPAHCTNYVALCVIHKAHCVKRGCPSLSYVGAPLRTLFMLVGPRRTRARESRFSFPPAPSGAPTSALYRAGNLALSAPHRGPDPGLCLSHPNTNGNIRTWQHCHGNIAMATWQWQHGNGNMAYGNMGMVTWQYTYGNGNIAHGNMAMAMWQCQWKRGNGVEAGNGNLFPCCHCHCNVAIDITFWQHTQMATFHHGNIAMAT